MAIRAATGTSRRRSGYDAGLEAAREAIDALGTEASLLLVFATADYDQPALLRAIREVGGQARVSGCSGEGIIGMGGLSEEDEFALSVMAIASEHTAFEPHLVTGYADHPGQAGASLGAQIAAGGRDDLMGVLVFPDGLSGNCTRMIAAISAELPGVPLIGGASADGMLFEHAWQYLDGEAHEGAVAAVAIRGPGHVEVAVSHGCKPLGLPRQVTHAEDGWIHQIDNLPAWDVFKEYLDPATTDLNAEGILHLCIGEPLSEDLASQYNQYVIRSPLTLDKASGALFFPGGGLTEGSTIRITRRDHETIRQSARECATRLLESHPRQKPALLLQFDCAGRGKALFGACAGEEIIRPLQEALGEQVPWAGFHTYGEIAPICDRPFYHNYTVALCALYDDPTHHG